MTTLAESGTYWVFVEDVEFDILENLNEGFTIFYFIPNVLEQDFEVFYDIRKKFASLNIL